MTAALHQLFFHVGDFFGVFLFHELNPLFRPFKHVVLCLGDEFCMVSGGAGADGFFCVASRDSDEHEADYHGERCL